MKASKQNTKFKQSPKSTQSKKRKFTLVTRRDIERATRDKRDPLDYESHPYPSMRLFAEYLALNYSQPRTRHSYYRDMRLVHEHFNRDPAKLSERDLREYFLHVKTNKQWRPKTIRQSAASARHFYHGMLELEEWRLFSQIKAKDDDHLPLVLTREQVIALLAHIRLRRYRTPIKLIYCCGLRLSECLSLTVHDIRGDEGKLMVRGGKGGRDRMLPVCPGMVQELRRYWKMHRQSTVAVSVRRAWSGARAEAA